MTIKRHRDIPRFCILDTDKLEIEFIGKIDGEYKAKKIIISPEQLFSLLNQEPKLTSNLANSLPKDSISLSTSE